MNLYTFASFHAYLAVLPGLVIHLIDEAQKHDPQHVIHTLFHESFKLFFVDTAEARTPLLGWLIRLSFGTITIFATTYFLVSRNPRNNDAMKWNGGLGKVLIALVLLEAYLADRIPFAAMVVAFVPDLLLGLYYLYDVITRPNTNKAPVQPRHKWMVAVYVLGGLYSLTVGGILYFAPVFKHPVLLNYANQITTVVFGPATLTANFQLMFRIYAATVFGAGFAGLVLSRNLYSNPAAKWFFALATPLRGAMLLWGHQQGLIAATGLAVAAVDLALGSMYLCDAVAHPSSAPAAGDRKKRA